MSDTSDRDLEQFFGDLRAADARSAPAFARVVNGRRIARKRGVMWPALATGAALIALISVWRLTSDTGSPFTIAPGQLRVPTDYLLDLASYPRAGDIPNIGAVDWFPLTGSDDRLQEAGSRRQQ
ncbi:MAG TPA: hypothetical protein VJ717_00405 [Gemmatimonadaceae bacterium]|nr:hypothetical protein [Gemmatimonadaceae bacterium]